MEEHRIAHIVGEEGEGRRIDAFIIEVLGLFPRSQLKQRLVRLRLNGRETKPAKRVKTGDVIEVVYSDPPPLALEPEAMDLDILFENDDVVVVNKPAGLVVHPGAGHRAHTLVNGLLAHCASLKGSFPDAPLRPGVVHRLDKDTSGVIIAAKRPAVLERLSSQFRKRRAKKLYLAFVVGRLKERSGRVETYIARDRTHRQRFVALRAGEEPPARGKRAVTAWRVLKEWEGGSLVALKPATGRTHQLRVHLKYLGCPIAGDPLYGQGRRTDAGRLMLHAWKLSIALPGEERARVFVAPLPEDFRKRLRKNGNADTAH
ncbi:MAG: RluA family pseudouridine synthase [Spirochaetales bacterium]|nr:RluA family pseudouridine synthase [Spirochaetales bacterium]